MNMTIIGAGNIGSVLGKKWQAAGHTVLFGVRNPHDPKYRELSMFGVLESIPASLAQGEVILLALPGNAVPEFLETYAEIINGKVIIDTTNDIQADAMSHYPEFSSLVPDSPYVRAFNTLGWENFAEPAIGWLTADLFFCGTEAARGLAEALIQEIGLNPVYVGGVKQIAVVDNLTRLWFALVFEQGYDRHTAFKLITE